MPKPRMLRVAFLLARDFTLTALSAFVDVLRLAGDEGDGSRPIGCRWDIVSLGREAARSSCGLFVSQGSAPDDPASYDYVVVVGGLLGSGPALAREDEAWLRRAARAGVALVGVCTGSFILCRLGLMQQRVCCISWYHAHDFTEEFPDITPVIDRLFVIDRDRITCSGGAGVADLAAVLVGERLGPSAAQKALNILLVDHPRGEQSAQPAPAFDRHPGRAQDAYVDRALILMEQNLAAPLKMTKVSEKMGISTRALERRFQAALGQSPGQAMTRLRLRHARWLLDHSDASVAAVAAETGFADASHFVRQYRRAYGDSPGRLRAGGKTGAQGEPRRVFSGA